MIFSRLFVFACCVVGSVGAFSAVAAADVPRAARPNIVYILADDLGYGDLGCYGQQQIATPNIDALARESLRFTQHYAGNSVCTPSRSSLLTGLHTGHTRHRDNPRFVDSYGFLPTHRTFAEVMRTAGYATAIAGKWHVGDRADTRDIASFHGFDFAYCVGYPYPDRGVEHWPSRLYTNGRETPIPENADARHGRYMDDLYTEAALRFIRENRAKPFLVYLSFQSVHAPLDAEISPTYAGRPWPDVEKRFASSLEKLDRNVARVLATLDELGLARDTVVFFTSDNGPHKEGGHDPKFFQSGGALRGGKRDLYEGGVRVPLLVRWPGVVRAGTTTDHVCAFWDMLPTFAELGGAEAPRGIDGLSFAPVLRGQPAPRHETLYWENLEGGGKQAVRAGNWKAVRLNVSRAGAAKLELYDLARDPAEQHDVAAAHPDIARRLEQVMTVSHVPSPRAPLLPGETVQPDPK
jgi:arylsulfatase A-like enzyme